MIVTTAVQGRRARKGDLVTRITVTLSIFNFSTRFSAQIVENRETQLSSPFLGPGDNFLQSYGAIFTDRAATGSGNLMDLMSTH